MKQKKVLTRATLAEAIHNKMGFSRLESADIVRTIIETLRESIIQCNELKIPLFGNFRVNNKKERMGRNPKTKEEAIIKARKVVTFHVSSNLKKLLTESDN
jgi:integration host factor subunit alpha